MYCTLTNSLLPCIIRTVHLAIHQSYTLCCTVSTSCTILTVYAVLYLLYMLNCTFNTYCASHCTPRTALFINPVLHPQPSLYYNFMYTLCCSLCIELHTCNIVTPCTSRFASPVLDLLCAQYSQQVATVQQKINMPAVHSILHCSPPQLALWGLPAYPLSLHSTVRLPGHLVMHHTPHQACPAASPG